MKKVFTLLLVLTMLMSFTACGTTQPNAPAGTTEVSDETAEYVYDGENGYYNLYVKDACLIKCGGTVYGAIYCYEKVDESFTSYAMKEIDSFNFYCGVAEGKKQFENLNYTTGYSSNSWPLENKAVFKYVLNKYAVTNNGNVNMFCNLVDLSESNMTAQIFDQIKAENDLTAVQLMLFHNELGIYLHVYPSELVDLDATEAETEPVETTTPAMETEPLETQPAPAPTVATDTTVAQEESTPGTEPDTESEPEDNENGLSERHQEMINSFEENYYNVKSLLIGEEDKPQASVWLSSSMASIISSDESVVTVTDIGKVTAVGEGTAYVIIDAAGMYEIYRYDVSGEIGTDETEELVLAPSNNGIDYRELIENFVPDHFNVIKLSVGESNKPSASVWLMSGNGCVYSSNENVVTVTDLGKVTAVGEGSAYVVISAMNTMHQVYRVDVSS